MSAEIDPSILNIQWTQLAIVGNWIYLRLPVKEDQTPELMKFALHEAGLSKALRVLGGYNREFKGEVISLPIRDVIGNRLIAEMEPLAKKR